MTAVQEFTSTDEMRRRYSAASNRLWGPRPKPNRYVPPAPPEPVVKPVSVEVVNTGKNEECEANGAEPEEVTRPTLHSLLQRVAMKHGLTVTEVISASRNKRLVAARYEYYYLAASETLHSYPIIGKYCGNRDHTTILHGLHKYCALNNLTRPRGAIMGDHFCNKIMNSIEVKRAIAARGGEA